MKIWRSGNKLIFLRRQTDGPRRNQKPKKLRTSVLRLQKSPGILRFKFSGCDKGLQHSKRRHKISAHTSPFCGKFKDAPWHEFEDNFHWCDANTTPTSRCTTFRSFSTWTAQPDLVLTLYSQLATCGTHRSPTRWLQYCIETDTWSSGCDEGHIQFFMYINHRTRFQTAVFPKPVPADFLAMPRIGTLKFPLRLAPCFFLRGRQAKLIHKHW